MRSSCCEAVISAGLSTGWGRLAESSSGFPAHSPRATRIALLALVLAWAAFEFPALLGRVTFPVDIAEAQPPASLYEEPGPVANPLGSDAHLVYYPLRKHLGSHLAEGELPLWDPHRFAGGPFAGNTQAAVFYPANWAFAILFPLAAFTVLSLVSSLAALLLFYWFARVLEVHPIAAAAGAIVFVYSGFFVAWGVHPTFLDSGMWLPLALGGFEVAFRGQRRRGIALAGVGLGASVLAGHAQVALYVWLAAGIWGAIAVVRGFARRREAGLRAAIAVPAAVTAAAFALGVAVSAVQLAATVEASSQIVRGDEPYEGLIGAGFPKRQLTTFFVPDRYGDPTDDNYAGAHNYTETSAYAGVTALVLAGIAFGSRRHRRPAIAFLILGAIAVLAAIGTPLYRLLYDWVPGFSQTRAIGRIVFLADVAIAGLAALGLDRAIRGVGRRDRTTALAAILVLAGIAVSTLLARPDPAPEIAYLVPRVGGAVLLAVATAGLVLLGPRRLFTWLGIVALLAADLWFFGISYFRPQPAGDVYPEVPEIAYLASVDEPRTRIVRTDGGPSLGLNEAMVFGLYDLQGSDTFITKRPVELLAQVRAGQLDAARDRNQLDGLDATALRSPILDLLGVGFVVGAGAPPEYPVVFEERFPIARRPDALPPAFLASCWRLVRPGTAAFTMASMTADDLRSTVLVDDEPEAREALGGAREGAGCAGQGHAAVRVYEEQRVVIEADARRDSVLVLTDSWYPGWGATVNGEESPVLVAGHAFRGIPLAAGRHTVELRYRPWWLLPGAVTTGLSLLIAGTAVVSGRRRPVV